MRPPFGSPQNLEAAPGLARSCAHAKGERARERDQCIMRERPRKHSVEDCGAAEGSSYKARRIPGPVYGSMWPRTRRAENETRGRAIAEGLSITRSGQSPS